MLGKLCKYELKSMCRTMLPLYIATLALALLSGLLGMHSVRSFVYGNSLFRQIPFFILNLLYFAINVALFVVTLLIVIQRFYKGLLCEEGYLMFTLPVKTWQLISAKGLIAALMSILSGCVSMLSVYILILFYGEVTMPNFSGLSAFFSELWNFSPSWPFYVVELIVLGVVSILSMIFMLYASMALGHLAKKHRVAWSFAAFLGLSAAENILAMTFFSVLAETDFRFLSPLFQMLGHISYAQAAAVGHIALIGLIVLSAIPLAAWFIITHVVLSHRLNLE